MSLFACILKLNTVLDPQIGYEGLIADCGDDVTLRQHVEDTKDRLRQYYQDKYVTPIPAPAAQPAVTEIPSGSPQKVNFTARYKKRPSTLKDELEEFHKLPQEDFEICDPIKWWAGRRSQFPNLSRLARDILAIPG
jgi:hypothetical protein